MSKLRSTAALNGTFFVAEVVVVVSGSLPLECTKVVYLKRQRAYPFSNKSRSALLLGPEWFE